MIHFRNVSFTYPLGQKVLEDATFSCEPSSFYFVSGSSGAGKTSLLRMIYAGIRGWKGEITLFGRDLATLKRSELPSLRQRMGIVFQDFRLLGHLSAFDNVALPLRMRKEPEGYVRDYAAQLLRWVGLEDHMDSPPRSLSGGQQQRVAIARAVITRPSLLLADEPTGNLDARLSERLFYLFEELHKLGTTVVFATHNEALLQQFPHNILRLHEGKVTLEEST